MAIQEIKPKPLRDSTLRMDGISERTMTEHYRLYQGYVNKVNEIRRLLETVDRSKANATYSDLRELKVELTFALGAVKNHDIYFGHLGGKGGRPEGDLLGAIQADFGSYERWEEDVRATALAARGWAWLALDYDDGHLYNLIGDAQNTFPIWNAVPILALDVHEHAYFLDYGTARPGYLEAFMRNLDWGRVARNYESARRQGR